ncbi:MAG TPA: hypothetical protein VK929_01020 [Longimicrobiales bacterium]|nr:hypothetical protein [Longimicrobiales bacterium]
MRNPLDSWRQRQARRRYMPHARTTKTGTIAKFSMVALVLIILAAALLDMRRGGGAEADAVAHVRENAVDALDLLVQAARSRRLVFLADVPSATAPKQFAAEAIERLATGPGLDLVVLDVSSDEQPFIDRYLATTPEDASILMGRPGAIREGDGASRAFVDVYRTVWRVNQELGAHRRVRIVAADPPGWPPARATAPHDVARMFGDRDGHMAEAVMQRALNREPNARVLFFVNGLHALKSGGGRVQTGGTRPVDVEWLAARMVQRYPQDVYTILTDASPSRVVTADVATYRGTQLADAMRRAGVQPGSAFRGHEALDAVSRTPVRVVGTTGIDFTMEPHTARFSDLADAYIYFGN